MVKINTLTASMYIRVIKWSNFKRTFPLIVPEPIKSPGLMLHPVTV